MCSYCYLALLLFAVAPHAGEAGVSSDSIVWRAERVCGVNCLYLMLRANARQVDYPILQRQLLKSDLNSLTELKYAAADWGLASAIASTNPSELRRIAMPLIAHLDFVDVRGVPSSHFVLVTKADNAGVQYIDGTTAEPLTVSWKEFAKNWSGNILVSTQSPRRGLWRYVVMAALGLATAFAIEKLIRNSTVFSRRVRS